MIGEKNYSVALWAPLSCLWRNKSLIIELTKREVTGRYKGSLLGLAWSFLYPLVMLAVYTFVFSIIFQAKWQVDIKTNKVDFALIIFTGMIIHSLFAECVNKAPSIITSNTNFVKKVIFPIDILVWTLIGSAIFHFVVSLLILITTQLIINKHVSMLIFLLPIVLLPLIFITAGISWFLSALGVYLRDIAQVTTVFTTILMFLSPIFFPTSAIPEKYRFLIELNPLTIFIEETRNILLFETTPDWNGIIKSYIAAFMIAYSGYFFFQKTRRGFADVL